MTEHEAPTSWFMFTPTSNLVRSEIESFNSPDIRMWAQDEEGVPNWFGWCSHHLDDASTKREFLDRATALKALFDGAMYLVYGSDYSEIRFDRSDGLHSVNFRGGDVRAEPFSVTALAKIHQYLGHGTRTRVCALVFQARYDSVAKDILKYVGVQKLSYFTLYALCDWMRKDGNWDVSRIATEAGLSNSRFNDFTHTANNPAYLGPFCRHGGGAIAPSRPMALADAEGPIRKATLAFLADRAQRFSLEAHWNAVSAPS